MTRGSVVLFDEVDKADPEVFNVLLQVLGGGRNNTRYITSPYFTSPHLTSPHLTSPHLTSPHLALLALRYLRCSTTGG